MAASGGKAPVRRGGRVRAAAAAPYVSTGGMHHLQNASLEDIANAPEAERRGAERTFSRLF